jgi:hypothetical protein
MHLYRLAFLFALGAPVAAGPAQATETIAFLRHGEKPTDDLGQLDCQGLNRALKLPQALASLFPATSFRKPAAIFVPDPSVRKKHYDYVRPLATIEPTAIALGMPIDTQVGFDDIKGLRKALEQPKLHEALVLVAWEHRMAEKAVRKLVKAHGGATKPIPKWKDTDFDSVYVVTIDWGRGQASFEQKSEGLDGQPQSCPQ